MDTYTSKPVFHSYEEEANIITIRYEPGVKSQGDSMCFIRRLSKWFGILLTIIWVAMAFAPDTFNIPFNFRPLVFLISILWFFAFCAGMFNP